MAGGLWGAAAPARRISLTTFLEEFSWKLDGLRLHSREPHFAAAHSVPDCSETRSASLG
jgi:hypothetical protein